jgi:hypothetical protein
MVNVIHHVLTEPVEDQQATEVFRHQWRMYRKLVDNDYFAHRKAIGDDGLLLIYEPTLRNGEAREGFLQRAETTTRSVWTALSGEEMDETVHHIRTCDFPETVATWEAMGRAAGFGRAIKLYDGPEDLFALFSFAPN